MGLTEILEHARMYMSTSKIELTPAQQKVADAEKKKQINMSTTDLKGYEVGHVCGRGGFGELREVYSYDRDEFLVFKYPRAEIVAKHGEKAYYIFEHEASLLDLLRHPNIVETYDTIHYNGIPHIPMEYLEVGIESFLGNRPPHEKVYQFMLQSVKAIKHLHSKGVVHCDIKPFQFMLNMQGVVKLMDLGGACFAGDKITPMSQMTIPYIPPHMKVPGKEVTVTPGLDIYAFGKSIATILLSHTKLDDDQLIGVLERGDDEEHLELLRQTGETDGKSCVPTRMIYNIIEPCLSAADEGSTFDAAELESRIKEFGYLNHLNPVPVIDILSGRQIGWTPKYKALRAQRLEKKRKR